MRGMCICVFVDIYVGAMHVCVRQGWCGVILLVTLHFTEVLTDLGTHLFASLSRQLVLGTLCLCLLSAGVPGRLPDRL